MATTITAGNATNGAAISSDNTGILEFKTGTGSGTTALTLSTGQQVAYALGTAAAPSITFSGDTNTGIFSPTADTIAFAEGGAEVARFDSAGNFVLGTTSSLSAAANRIDLTINGTSSAILSLGTGGARRGYALHDGTDFTIANETAGALRFLNSGSERARITSTGNFAIGTTVTTNFGDRGLYVSGNNGSYSAVSIGASGSGYGCVGYGIGFTATDGQIKALATDNMSWLRFQNGAFQFFQQTSATAGTTYTGTQAMTLDANGRLGIGVTTPGVGLQVTGNASALVSTTHYWNYNGSSGTSGQGILTGYFTGTGVGGMIAGDAAGGTVNNLTFCGYNGSAWNELMRLRGDGNLLVGTTTSHSKLTVQGQGSFGSTGSGGNGIYLYINNALSDNSYLSRGSAGTGTTTWYIGNQTITTSSDERLKANIAPTERNALELLQQWEIVDHTWNDPSDQCENNRNSRGVWTGVVAQQVQPITPWLVNKPLEEINEDGSINPWTMDFGYAVPLLVKAIQELKAELDATKAEVAALKGEA